MTRRAPEGWTSSPGFVKVEHVFDTVDLLDRPLRERPWDDAPRDDARLQRLLDADPGDEGVPLPEDVPPVSQVVPSGWTALELEPTDPASLGDRELLEHLVAWERHAAWAQARQGHLLAELRQATGDRVADDRPAF